MGTQVATSASTFQNEIQTQLTELLSFPGANFEIPELPKIEPSTLNIQSLWQQQPPMVTAPVADNSVAFTLGPNDMSDHVMGQVFQIKPGQKFRFLAEATPSTGYQWNYSIDPMGFCGAGAIKLLRK